MKTGWNKMTRSAWIVNILIIVLSGAVVVLTALQLLGIWEDSIKVYEPLIGIFLLLQVHIAPPNSRQCGAKRPQCVGERPG